MADTGGAVETRDAGTSAACNDNGSEGREQQQHQQQHQHRQQLVVIKYFSIDNFRPLQHSERRYPAVYIGGVTCHGGTVYTPIRRGGGGGMGRGGGGGRTRNQPEII